VARAGRDVLVLEAHVRAPPATRPRDQPAAGSRFAPDDTLLEGPATRNPTAAQ